jgi:hypothetical protein
MPLTANYSMSPFQNQPGFGRGSNNQKFSSKHCYTAFNAKTPISLFGGLPHDKMLYPGCQGDG